LKGNQHGESLKCYTTGGQIPWYLNDNAVDYVEATKPVCEEIVASLIPLPGHLSLLPSARPPTCPRTNHIIIPRRCHRSQYDPQAFHPLPGRASLRVLLAWQAVVFFRTLPDRGGRGCWDTWHASGGTRARRWSRAVLASSASMFEGWEEEMEDRRMDSEDRLRDAGRWPCLRKSAASGLREVGVMAGRKTFSGGPGEILRGLSYHSILRSA